jgi:hypothetical protein
MRRISADRGMTFGLKCQLRHVFRDSGARDNEETVIGTQLRFGMGRLPTTSAAESEGR